MIRTITDITGTRSIKFDFRNKKVPGSIFIMGGAGFCIEIARSDLMAAFKAEFNLFSMDIPDELLVGFSTHMGLAA